MPSNLKQKVVRCSDEESDLFDREAAIKGLSFNRWALELLRRAARRARRKRKHAGRQR